MLRPLVLCLLLAGCGSSGGSGSSSTPTATPTPSPTPAALPTMDSVVSLLSQLRAGAITSQPTAAQAVLSSSYVQVTQTGLCCGSGKVVSDYTSTQTFNAQNQGSNFQIFVCDGKVESANYTVNNNRTALFDDGTAGACN